MTNTTVKYIPEYCFDAVGIWYYCRYKDIYMFSVPFTVGWKAYFIDKRDFVWNFTDKDIPEDIKQKFIEYTKSEFFEIDYKRWKNGV